MDMKSEHIAKLTVHDLPSSMKRRRYELASWLRKVAFEIENEDPKIWAKRASFRYMRMLVKSRKKK